MANPIPKVLLNSGSLSPGAAPTQCSSHPFIGSSVADTRIPEPPGGEHPAPPKIARTAHAAKASPLRSPQTVRLGSNSLMHGVIWRRYSSSSHSELAAVRIMHGEFPITAALDRVKALLGRGTWAHSTYDSWQGSWGQLMGVEVPVRLKIELRLISYAGTDRC